MLVPGAGDDPPGASARAQQWPAWLAANEPWAQAPEQRAGEHHLHLGHDRAAEGRRARTPATDEQREAGRRRCSASIFQLGEGERTVIPAPMYHTAPNVYALASALRGMDMTIMERFDAEEFLRIVAGAPRRRSCRWCRRCSCGCSRSRRRCAARYDLSSLRWIVHAAAPCPPDVKRAMIDWLGPIVAEYYGGTETGPGHLLHERGVARPPGHRRARRSAARQMKILGEDGDELPRRRVGRGLHVARRAGRTSPTKATRRSAARSSATA